MQAKSPLEYSSMQIKIQGQKQSCYLLKSGDLVASNSSVYDKGRTEAEDVSQQGVEL